MTKATLLLTAIFLTLFVVTQGIAQIVVDGTINETQYITLGSKQNSNAGFGTAIDVNQISYYADATAGTLYLAIVSKLNTSSDDELGIWLNVTSRNGDAAGTALGGIAGTGSFFSDGTNSNYKADFEVDYQFAFNPGSGSSNVYFDAANNWGTKSSQYMGPCDQSGTSVSGPSEDGVFTTNSITWAYNNSGASNTGLEMAIPFSELGATSSDFINVFAFIVSKTAYFSDVTVPGNVSGGSLGNNPDFGTISGGAYHTNLPDGSLPVELTSFTALGSNGKVALQWITQSEVNNQGFILERADEKDGLYREIASYKTAEVLKSRGNLSREQVYTYTDNGVLNGVTYWYKLIDVDVNGVRTEHGAVSARPQANRADLDIVNQGNLPQHFALRQNYPNPFNPDTKIRFEIPQLKDAANVRLTIYDITGKKVNTLLNASLGAGIYEITWNGKNLHGLNLPSGIYFYALQSEKFTATKKLMLVR